MTMEQAQAIYVRPALRGVAGVFYGALLSFVGALITVVVRDGSTNLSFLAKVFAVVLMATMALTLAWALVWTIIGVQVIAVRDGQLVAERRVGHSRLGRPRLFDVALVRNLRIEERQTRAKGRPIVRYAVVFDFEG